MPVVMQVATPTVFDPEWRHFQRHVHRVFFEFAEQDHSPGPVPGCFSTSLKSQIGFGVVVGGSVVVVVVVVDVVVVVSGSKQQHSPFPQSSLNVHPWLTGQVIVHGTFVVVVV